MWPAASCSSYHTLPVMIDYIPWNCGPEQTPPSLCLSCQAFSCSDEISVFTMPGSQPLKGSMDMLMSCQHGSTPCPGQRQSHLSSTMDNNLHILKRYKSYTTYYSFSFSHVHTWVAPCRERHTRWFSWAHFIQSLRSWAHKQMWPVQFSSSRCWKLALHLYIMPDIIIKHLIG